MIITQLKISEMFYLHSHTYNDAHTQMYNLKSEDAMQLR